jgi:hypothetical protein
MKRFWDGAARAKRYRDGRWFILTVALRLDPAAVLLLLGAVSGRRG